MLYYLYTIDQTLNNKDTPYDAIIHSDFDKFIYNTLDNKKYFVLQIDNENIKILDEHNVELASGGLAKSSPNEINFGFSSCKLLFAGGYLTIKGNECILYIYGSGLPYIGAYKGILRRLLKRE